MTNGNWNYDTFNLTNESCWCADGMIGACCGEYKPGILSPAVLDFGNVNNGSTKAAQTLVAYFTPLSRSNMTVRTITRGGTNPNDFALGIGTCAANTNVTGSSNCTISVTFMPIATGLRSAILYVNTSEPNGTNPQSLTTTLTGTGITTVSRVLVDPLTPATVFAGLDGAGTGAWGGSGGVLCDPPGTGWHCMFSP